MSTAQHDKFIIIKNLVHKILARDSHEFARLTPKFARVWFASKTRSTVSRVSPAPPQIDIFEK